MPKKKKETEQNEALIEWIVKGIQEKKGKDIVVLDMRNLKNAVADQFVICHADNARQVTAIADSVEEFTGKNLNEKPWHIEGTNNASWVLIDYVNVVVHVFHKEYREFFNLEGLWADAERKEYETII